MKKLLAWFDQRFPLVSTWKTYASDYYVPKNLNIFYVFGALALLVLLNQLLSGLWLTMFYTPTAAKAFDSVQILMRDINYGWLLRYLHSTGASAFFIIIYLHMFRGLLYGSYQRPRELIWLLGMALFILLLAEAFFGYLLPWGQMSYWGAQVITSLVGAIPWIGDTLVIWLRGDYHIGNPTLQRFFALHVIALPLLLILFVFFHIVALHKVGSNNPEGIEIRDTLDEQGNPVDGIPFHPYYTVNDLLGMMVFFMLFFGVLFFIPDMAGYFLEPANFEPANPMVTPEHITPMWYMTPFYSILRTVPDKLGGLLVMGLSFFMLLLLPWLDRSPVKSMRYKGCLSRYALVALVCSVICLGVLAHCTLTANTQSLARACTIIYFAYFLLMPFYTRFEKHKIVPLRIVK